MEYTSENIEQAVSLFYKTDSAQQATAHQWLTDAQNSPHAWSFVWDLLDPRRVSCFPIVHKNYANLVFLGFGSTVFCCYDFTHQID